MNLFPDLWTLVHCFPLDEKKQNRQRCCEYVVVPLPSPLIFTILNSEEILSSCRNAGKVHAQHSYVMFKMIFFAGFSFRAAHSWLRGLEPR